MKLPLVRAGLTLVLLLGCFTLPAAAQKRAIHPTLNHARVWAVDTLLVDSKGIKRPAHSAGMLGFVCVYHKDAVHALCEFVAKDASAHDPLKAVVGAHADPLMFCVDKNTTKHATFEKMALAAGFTDADLRHLMVATR
jgi:hypothetical protein